MAYNGPLPQVVKAGGSGAATLTGVLTGNGTSAFTASTVTQHAVLVGGPSNSVTSTSVGSTGQVLQANTGADPTYSTATYPSLATGTGTILRADGTNWVATTATYPNTTTISQLLYSSANNTIAGLATANRGVLTTGTTGVPVITALATDGQIIIGSTAGVPAAATLTAGTGITITNASNSITISANGSVVLETLTGNTGGAISPTAGNINTVGTGSITIAGSGSTLTTQLTGLTNHNVLVGAGTATITNVAPSATSGVPLISQGSSSDPAFGTAVVAGGGTGSTSFNTTGVVISGATSTTALSSITLTAGQLAIGSNAGNPAAATLTAGAGIAITNGNNSITIAATGAGFAWSDTSGTFTAVKENGYFITATSTATLPSSPSAGDTIAFIVDTTQILTITANTGQQIRVGSTVSAAAGTCANNARGDSIELVYRSTDTTWIALSVVGTWTVT